MADIRRFPRSHRSLQHLDNAEATRIVRLRAKESANVIFTFHAEDRMDERGISRLDIERVLLEGTGSSLVRNEKDEWQITMKKKTKGSREIGAVTVILSNEDKIIVKTVMWIDP